MKIFYIVCGLAITMLCCREKPANRTNSDWGLFEKRSEGSTIKILCAIPDIAEFNFLNNELKPLLKKNFNIKALIYYMSREKILKTLLNDSRRNNKVNYDLIIADANTMQNLNNLGILYGKYLDILPNSKEIDYSYINALKPNSELREFVVPYSGNRYIIVHDTCEVSPEQLAGDISLPELTFVKDENTVANIYFLAKHQNAVLREDRNNNPDSVVMHLLYNALAEKDIPRLARKRNLHSFVMRNSQFNMLQRSGKVKDLAVTESRKLLPVHYKLAAISNSSPNVSASMVVINQLLAREFQFKKYKATGMDDLPVMNISTDDKDLVMDSVLMKSSDNFLTKPNIFFTIGDYQDMNAWLKQLSSPGK